MTTPTLFFSFIGGLLSVLSPCVLPVIPIVISGNQEDSKFRPLLITLGIGITFIMMGILSTLFGQVVAPYMQSLEKVAAVLIILFGILLLFNLNLFKKLTIFNKINYSGTGLFSGLILGMTLGLIWIPCVGPVLSSILTMVASTQDMTKGIVYLSIYTAGFSIPLLIAAYFSHFFKEKFSFVKKRPSLVRYTNSAILIAFGIYILVWGMIGISL